MIADYFDVTLGELLDEKLTIRDIDRTARVLATHLHSDITDRQLHAITDYMDKISHNTTA